MYVYVVMDYMDYDGGGCCGVYATQESAKKAIEEAPNNKDRKVTWLGNDEELSWIYRGGSTDIIKMKVE